MSCQLASLSKPEFEDRFLQILDFRPGTRPLSGGALHLGGGLVMYLGHCVQPVTGPNWCRIESQDDAGSAEAGSQFEGSSTLRVPSLYTFVQPRLGPLASQ